MYRPIRWPPVSVPPSPKPPKPTPPEPGTGGTLPPGTGLPPDPIVVTPPQPQPPKDETPQQYRDGWWSDGWVVVRQTSGILKLTMSDGTIRLVDVRTAGANAAQTTNWLMEILGAAARPTQIEPWPPARTTPQKSSKETLLNTQVTDAEKLDLLLVLAEQQARDIATVKGVLVTYQAEQEEMPKDVWADAFTLAAEPPGLDQPLTSFEPMTVARYAVFGRSVVNGSKTYPDPRRVALAKALALGTDLDAQGEAYIELLAKWEVDRDVAILALLTGLVDPYDTSFDARIERDVAQLAGTVKPETLSTGEVIPRFVRLDFEGCYKRLLPSGSGGTASGNEG